MALQKTILESNGVITSYHRLGNVTLGHDKILTCTLESYVDKEYARQSRNRVSAYYFTFKNVSLEEEESTGIRELAYNKIKQEEAWHSAVDC